MKRGFLVLLWGAFAATLGWADEAGSPRDLPNWSVGVQTGFTWRNERDVYERFSLGTAVETKNEGGFGLSFNRRFADRFILGLHVSGYLHSFQDDDRECLDFEALVTGTVRWRTRHTLQPFLKGGCGASGQELLLPAAGGDVGALGAGAIAGGGVNVQVSRRIALELEFLTTFTNYVQVRDDSTLRLGGGDEDWQVRTSDWGIRVSLGLVLWF